MEKNETATLQKLFLSKIKDLVPSNLSLADELCDLLGISSDSAYRRLRGETALTIDEVAILCKHYRISLDSVGSYESETVTFNYHFIKNRDEYKKYLETIKSELGKILAARERVIYYAAVDIPVFYNFNFPLVSLFKSFYWLKSVVNNPEMAAMKFSRDFADPEISELGKDVFKIYSAIPSVEIWNEGSVSSLVKQIGYYWESGLFESSEDALELCNQLEQEMNLIQRQAEISRKLLDENHPGGEPNNFTMYFSEIEIGNNCILATAGDMKAVYLSHSTFNKIVTLNPGFCEGTAEWINNLIKKSNLISGVSEKQRYQFFKSVKEKIQQLKEKIK
ncbi:MAG: hypothetical protein A2W91_07625 [Bacteroidetes bacterium GWF2_38_335]|nr:MAG: hypothetical protein A2W91_07625 [Bacteroidetes bacterium GWF2_38_335]OFY79071.1 MAG: hypothetical protein A2281_03095 [Bacteroidetes bacterium RIFOXYA12_FULL_38_20]HBS86157.1 hypothetical protein [Bacteroidales bacterium]